MPVPAKPRFRIPPPPQLGAVANYAIAVGAPLAALLVEISWRSAIEPIPFVLFFFVVSFVGSIGGIGPGAVSVVASAAAGYHFLATSANPDRAAAAAAGTALFAPVGFVIAAFGALVRAGFREREAAAVQLRRAVESRDRLISTAAHELRTPITTLLLSTQRLPTRGDAPALDLERLRRTHDSIARQARRLARLIERLLDVSRITSGRLQLELDDFDLVSVVEEIADQLAPELASSGTQLTVEARSRPVAGRWDRTRVEQVLANLLDNANKYGAGKPVHVTVQQVGGLAEVAVQDHGIGIPPEARARIFDRFERAVDDAGISGFGIGLWITREIVTALGGTVTVESTPGQGSTFKVRLPLSRPARTAPGREAG